MDVALLRNVSGRVEVLLIQRGRDPFKGLWALPGGFVDQNESLADAAARELKEETGITAGELRQVGAFGDPGRDPRGHTISIAFAGWIETGAEATAGDDAAQVKWLPLSDLPDLAFDHAAIIKAVVEKLLVDRR